MDRYLIACHVKTKGMAKVMITGGTGLVGKALSKLLVEKGYEVIIISRRGVSKNDRKSPNIEYAQWDVGKQTIEASAIRNSDYIIHLAGAGIADKRWTEKRKKEIQESRIQSSKLLLKAIKETPNKIIAVISASAIGWYGEDPLIPNPRPFIETDPSDPEFLGETCKLWEESIEPVTSLGKRLVIIRTGIVFSNAGGAFKEFKRPVKFGIAAILGNGNKPLVGYISMIFVKSTCMR